MRRVKWSEVEAHVRIIGFGPIATQKATELSRK